jgi:sortase B
MKKRVNGWKAAAGAAHVVDSVLNKVIAVALLLVFLYGAHGLLDTWQVYSSAGIDSEILKYKPSADGDDASNPTLSDLMKVNSDVCAWLTVNDTAIDYPVVQGQDNLEYINKDVYGEFSLSGSVFLDYRNQKDFSDFYSLLYAHHLEGNVMFGEIPNFREDEYFQTHKEGMLFLPEKTYRIEWFACLNTDAYDVTVFRPMVYNTQSLQNELLTYLKQESVQYRDLGVEVSDQIIGLSTCEDATTNGRVLLFGRLTENNTI